ncbi:MAG: class I SAM-dependent methyltransferase [Armatimonadota bacterium]
MDEDRTPDLLAETRRIWDTIAEWWDDKIGDGNAFQTVLIEPINNKLLGEIARQTILDIGCGAGRFARMMAERGAHVVAFDFSERFITRAKERTPADMPIEYHVTDATDERALLSFGPGRFDQAVATMSLMDMASIEPLFRAMPVLLKPGGHFIFTIMHPCFQPPFMVKYAELGEEDALTIRRNGVKIPHYLTPAATRGIGIAGQAEAQYYFHRPLSAYLNTAFAAGFVLDGLEEPCFPPEGANPTGLRWREMPEIPPLLAVRLRNL